MTYTFWNNKGGTGKSSLAFQTINEYAFLHADHRILAIDLCPQANLSELFFGGLVNDGGAALQGLAAENVPRTIGGYFQFRLPSPFAVPQIDANQFISNPSAVNVQIPRNVDLVAGDRIVELLSNSMSSLAISAIPNVPTYLNVIDWVRNLIEAAVVQNGYDVIFLDTNPSFAIYTQMALAATERLIVPVMADDSSRRALSNILTLVYGLNSPLNGVNAHAFHAKLTEAQRPLPQVHLIVKNRLTQYMGPASAYGSVLRTIDRDIATVIANNPQHFTFDNIANGVVEVRDFGTTGVVAFAEATPFRSMRSGVHRIDDRDTQISMDNIRDMTSAIRLIAERL